MTIIKFSRTIGAAVLSLVLIAPSFSFPALATKDDSQNTDPIVVTGQKTISEVIRQVIRNQFNISNGSNQTGQYARFASPICPSVGGLPKEQASLVEDRIRDIAEIAELRVATNKCKANLFVVAVENGAEEINRLRNKRGRLFASLTHSQREKMIKSGGPVYSWKSTQRMASDSAHPARAGNYTILAGPMGDIKVKGQRTHVKSKFLQTEFAGISYSYLFIENRVLSKVSVNQLADYAAVVSLIDIDVNFKTTPPPTNSILSLFSNDQSNPSTPQSIGEGDLLMLRGLYKVPANVKAPLQRSAMLHTIKNALESDEKQGK